MDTVGKSISVKNVHRALEQLLARYLLEKEESQGDNDTRFIEYWDSACQTIYDLAAALHIPLEEQPDIRHLHTPDSMTPPGLVDVQRTLGAERYS